MSPWVQIPGQETCGLHIMQTMLDKYNFFRLSEEILGEVKTVLPGRRLECSCSTLPIKSKQYVLRAAKLGVRFFCCENGET